MEIFNIGVAERFLSFGYGVVAILNSCADMLFKIRRPLMAGIKTLHIFMGMGCVVSYGLISVEPEACPCHENEDYRVIPVDDLSRDKNKLQILTELEESFCGARLKFCDLSLAGR